jgi:glycosidase
LSVNGSGKFNDIDVNTLRSLKKLGCTHIWFTGVIEHSTKTDYTLYGILKDNPSLVKGEAGSPYAVKDYFDVDPDLAVDVNNRISEFSDLINRTHKVGLKAIMDFVPNHVAREYFSDKKPSGIEDFGAKDKSDYSFHPMNNYYYILNEYFKSPVANSFNALEYTEFPSKVTGNDCFMSHPDINDWYETVKLNYGVDYNDNNRTYFNPVPDTWKKMRAIMDYWLDLGVDGFRCDMAEMVPVEFWKWAIKSVKKSNPDVLFIAEVYNPVKYSDYLNIAGFDYLYDKVGLSDTLRRILTGEVPAFHITRSWQSLGDMQSRMLNFLENHDEQRIASDYYLKDPNLAIPALTVSLMFNTTPFMIYFGQELGERGMDEEGFSGLDGRTSIFDYWSVSTIRKWRQKKEVPVLRDLYKKLLNTALSEKAIRIGQTFDLGYVNSKSGFFDPDYHFAFFRYFDKELIFIVVNFSNKDCLLMINIPKHCFDFFKISENFADSGMDLITGERVHELLSHTFPYTVSIMANNIRIIKFLLQ